MGSGLYEELVEHDLLIAHREVETAAAAPETAAVVLEPTRVPVITYPYEWSPGQLRAAAQVTLRAQRAALRHGLTLRDASAYNVQFVDGRPVLIDTLSFGRYREGSAWAAYGQFCRHFVAPLALMKYVDVRLGQLLRSHLDGLPLDLTASMLPRRTKFPWGLGLHIHAHSSSQSRNSPASRAPRVGRSVSLRATIGLVESLSALIDKLTWDVSASTWRDYYALGGSYADESMAHKRETVADYLESSPSQGLILDLGANTGEFSRLSEEVTGAVVVAIEQDPSAVEVMWRSLAEDGPSRVVPLINDLTNPSPCQGWAQAERSSLFDRTSQADVVLALALVHHLAIGNNVPLRRLVEWLAELAPTAIVEWIPKEDPMVQRMLSTREDHFADYTTEGFEEALTPYYQVERRDSIKDSERTLYLLRSRQRP